MRLRNESLITRARNVCAASFLNETDYECLLFIDADIEFEPGDVARLWNLCSTLVSGADVSVGAYRHKNPDAKLEVWVKGKLRPLSDFSEPFEVDYAGTGFMMIRRETFERLQKAHPEWKYVEGFPTENRTEIKDGNCWAFFQDPLWEHGGPMLGLNRIHLSEDYFFCKEVRELGMKVICDPEIRVGHWGMYRF